MIIEVEGYNLTELLESLLKQLKAASIIKVCELNENEGSSKVFLKNLKYKGSLEEIFKKLIEDLLLLGEFCLVNLKIEKVKKVFNSNTFIVKLLLVVVERKTFNEKYCLKDLEFFIKKGKKFLITKFEKT
jgi:hypothetical protein